MTLYTVMVNGEAVITTEDRAEADAAIDAALKGRGKKDIRLLIPRGQ